MKNIIIYMVIPVFLAMIGCAQKKENREEFKNEHNKDSLRNKLGNSAVPNSEQANVEKDSSTVSKRIKESPTNYKKNNKPNTSGGGSR